MQKRVKEPPPDSTPIVRFEIDFHIPVYLTDEHQRKLHALFAEIINDHCNQPTDGVHWLAGSGSKPSLSKADAAFLGKEADPNAPETGEPTFDHDVLYYESFSRGFVSAEELRRTKERRA